MSLTAQQRRQTQQELLENYQICALAPEVICADLKINPLALEEVLAMTDANPTTVWKVRDYMEKKIHEQGKTPVPYSALKVNIWYRYD